MFGNYPGGAPAPLPFTGGGGGIAVGPSLGWQGAGASPGPYQPNPGLQGGSISGSHTSTAAETAFTFVTYTFPRPAQPITLMITTSTGSGLVQVVLDNQRNLNIPFATNTIVSQPMAGIIGYAVNALSVGFEALSGVLTVTATVSYI